MRKGLLTKLAAAAAIVVAGAGVTIAAQGEDPEKILTDHGAKIAKEDMTRVLRAAEGVSADVPKAELEAEGEKLFNGAGVALEGESCAACHITGGGVNSPLGVIVHRKDGGPKLPDDFTGLREAPALWDIAETAPYNWVGGNPTLESQATAAITTHFKPEQLVDGTANPRHVAALVAFMKTIKAPASRQDQGRLTPKELEGEEIFVGKGGCIACHGGPQFTDNLIHRIDVPQNNFPGLKGTANDPGSATIPGGFNTPQLRDVGNTAPYMHNGAFKTLEDVVKFYNGNELTGGPLRLTDEEIEALVAYLKAL